MKSEVTVNCLLNRTQTASDVALCDVISARPCSTVVFSHFCSRFKTYTPFNHVR